MKVFTDRSTASEQIPAFLQQRLVDMRFTELNILQRAMRMPFLIGRDIFAKAAQRSGKTAAFCIPLFEKLFTNTPQTEQPVALVIVPDRGVAAKVHRVMSRFFEGTELTCASFCQGTPVTPQLERLKKGVHVVIATMDRVYSLLRRDRSWVSLLQTVILYDTAHLLNEGTLAQDWMKWFKDLSTNPQLVVLTEQISLEAQRQFVELMVQPEMINLLEKTEMIQTMVHSFYMVSGLARSKDLLKVLDFEAPKQAVIFTNTDEEVSQIVSYLKNHGYMVDFLEEKSTLADRARVANGLKQQTIQYLVLSDISEKGDPIGCDYILHYTFPENPSAYMERIGHLGYAPKSVVSLISHRDLPSFYTFKLASKIKPEEKFLPSNEELASIREQHYLKRLFSEFKRSPQVNFYGLIPKLLASGEGVRVIASLIERFLVFSSQGLPLLEKSQKREDDFKEFGDKNRKKRADLSPRNESVDQSFTESPKKKPARKNDKKEKLKPVYSKNVSMESEQRQKDLKIDQAITAEDGRDFWEAWVDSKKNSLQSNVSSTPVTPDLNTTNQNEQKEAVLEIQGADFSTKMTPESVIVSEQSIEQLDVKSEEVPSKNKGNGKRRILINLGQRDGLTEQSFGQYLVDKGLGGLDFRVGFSSTQIIAQAEQISQAQKALHGQSFDGKIIRCRRPFKRPVKK